jgi:hypothetical protein
MLNVCIICSFSVACTGVDFQIPADTGTNFRPQRDESRAWPFECVKQLHVASSMCEFRVQRCNQTMRGCCSCKLCTELWDKLVKRKSGQNT